MNRYLFNRALVIFLTHHLRRKRSPLGGSVRSLRAAARIRARKLSMSSRCTTVILNVTIIEPLWKYLNHNFTRKLKVAWFAKVIKLLRIYTKVFFVEEIRRLSLKQLRQALPTTPTWQVKLDCICRNKPKAHKVDICKFKKLRIIISN